MITAADLFAGAGGTSTGLARACANKGVGLDLIAVNHWDLAIEAHKKNHPEARHICAALEGLNPRELVKGGRLNILVASPECFPAGTIILTSRGLVGIEEVRIGDWVLTHLGRWRPVRSVMSKVAETIIVKGQGHPGLETTDGHPFFARRKSRKWNNACREYDYAYSSPGWLPASKLTDGIWRWATPVTADPLPVPEIPGRGMSLDDPEFWWMVGRWLGDGVLRIREGQGSELTIVAGDEEADDLEKRLNYWYPKHNLRSGKDELRWRRRRIRTAWLFECGHVELCRWLARHFGRLAHGKTLPSWALTLPVELRQALLGGYLSADGNIGERTTEGTTVSKRLAIGIRLLAESLGHRVALHCRPQHCSEIEGRRVNVRDLWTPRWENNRSQRSAFSEGRHSWSLVKEIKPGREAVIVFNLSVEEDESYVADGIVVHNCTHHSSARGGKPMNDQSRSSAWLILKWLQELYVETLLIENVSEFQFWGPLGANGRPLKSKRGVLFEQFLESLRAMGYNVEWRILNAANYGDPTTRERLFILGRRGRNRVIKWPEATHAQSHKTQNLFGERKPWRAAREIIDWSTSGTSIFNRKKPLAHNTLKRILAGMQKFKWPEPFLVILRQHMSARSLDQPLPTLTAGGTHVGLVEPFTLGQQSGGAPRSIEDPLPTVAAGGAISLIEPFILPQFGQASARDLDRPLGVVTTTSRGIGFVAPFIVPFFGENDGQKPRVHSVEEPLPAVTSHGAGAVVEPFIMTASHGDGDSRRCRSINHPLPTVTSANDHGIVEPFVTRFDQQSGSGARARSIDRPLPTVTTKNGLAIVEGVAEPFVVEMRNGKTANSIEDPLSTVTTLGAHHGIAQPFIDKYYGTGAPADVNDPLDTVTAKQRFGLCQVGDSIYDIRFRMLKPRELARAQGFPDSYQFVGGNAAITKMIGNAVCVNLAEALCRELIA